MKRYRIHPGHVRSAHDGQEHYIPAHRLISLYRVPPDECVIVDPERPAPAALYQDLIPLRPDPTGRYRTPGMAAHG